MNWRTYLKEYDYAVYKYDVPETENYLDVSGTLCLSDTSSSD